jgi:hypothetical protein
MVARDLGGGGRVTTVPTSEPARDRWGRYMIDGDPYTRVTTIAKALDDNQGLLDWKACAAVVGAMRRPGLHKRWEALMAEHPDPWYGGDSAKKACKALVKECTEAGGTTDRADTGTALHRLTELHDLGQLGKLLDDSARDIAAYAEATSVLEMVEVETILLLDHYKVAGTCDRIVRHGGKLYIADVKTGTNLDWSWPSIAVQLAAYANATAIWRTNILARSPMLAGIDRTRALVIHLPAGEGRCELHWVDIEAGWRAFELSMQVRDWRKAKGLVTPAEIGPTLALDAGYIVNRRAPVDPFDGLTTTTTPYVITAGDVAAIAATRGKAASYETLKKAYAVPAIRPPLPEPDDSTMADPAAVAELQKAFKALAPEQWAAIKQVAAEAAATGHPVSVARCPSRRRFAIGRALIAWVQWDYSIDGLSVLLAIQAGHLISTLDIGRTVGLLTEAQADGLCDVIARLEAGAALTFDATGAPSMPA